MRATTITLIVFAAAAGGEQPKLRLYSEVAAIRNGQKLLWQDPGAVERKDLRYGVGGRALAPRPPFTFLEEDTVGASPKVLARDRAGRKWSVKFGNEVSGDVFGSRMAWALGYYAEPTYYVARGTLRRAGGVKGLEEHIDAAGRFRHARFQLRSGYHEYLKGVSWSWEENPFVGTRQLNGLKILTMLLANWDNKDIRDAGRGSNSSIYRAGRKHLFFVNDWGSSMGDHGRGPTQIVKHFTHSKWDCADYRKQSHEFVKIDDGELDWDYSGVHSKSMKEGVTARDVQWLMRYLGRLTPQQIREGLLASGATAAEVTCFTEALRLRIRALASVSVVQTNRQPSNPRPVDGGSDTVKSRGRPPAASAAPR